MTEGDMMPGTPRSKSIRHEMAASLRDAVLAELRARNLVDPPELAKALGLALIKAEGLLKRNDWEIEESILVIDRLGLPVTVQAMPIHIERISA